MILYEFINPSDCYLFEAPDFEIATAVTFWIGLGQCPATPVIQVDSTLSDQEIKELEVPMFLFGGVEEWVHKKFGLTLDQFIVHIKSERKDELITALKSFIIGDVKEREFYLKTMNCLSEPQDKEMFRKEWHEMKCTSLTDYGEYVQLLISKIEGV
jgi:hypothetical protein